MLRIQVFFCGILLCGSVFAAPELPSVNYEKSVSARELFGESGEGDAPSEVRLQKKSVKSRAVQREHNYGKLIPQSKPGGDLWARKSQGGKSKQVQKPVYDDEEEFAMDEPPLRLPEKSDFAVLTELPEESLEEEIAELRRSPAPEPVYDYDELDDWDDENFFAAVRQTKTQTPAKSLKGKQPTSTIKSYQPAKKARVPEPVQKKVSRQYDDDDDAEFAYNGDVPLTKLSPAQLKKAFKKTFTTENKHLSAYQIDNEDDYGNTEFDEQSEGFDSSRDLSETDAGIRPLEIKLTFDDDDSALTRDNYNLLTEYAGIVAANPKRAVQISISEKATRSYDGRKLAARRLAIIEQVLKDSGIVDKRVMPVLSQRTDDSFVLRMISREVFQTLTEQKKDAFGDSISKKTTKSMKW